MAKSKIPAWSAGRQNPKSKIQKFYSLSLVILISFAVLSSGCAVLIEGAKGFAGVSTKSLEKNRKDAIIRKFDCDYFNCFTKASDILKSIDAHIYAQSLKKQMIAAYVSKQDTTPVGIFFKEIDANHTQIEVSSPSVYARELVSARLFPALDKSLYPETEQK